MMTVVLVLQHLGSVSVMLEYRSMITQQITQTRVGMTQLPSGIMKQNVVLDCCSSVIISDL